MPLKLYNVEENIYKKHLKKTKCYNRHDTYHNKESTSPEYFGIFVCFQKYQHLSQYPMYIYDPNHFATLAFSLQTTNTYLILDTSFH